MLIFFHSCKMTSYPAGGLTVYKQKQTVTVVELWLQTQRLKPKPLAPPNCLFSLNQAIETSAESVAAFFDSCPCKVSNSWQPRFLRVQPSVSQVKNCFREMDGFRFWSGASAAGGVSGFNMQHKVSGHHCSAGDWKGTGHAVQSEAASPDTCSGSSSSSSTLFSILEF